MTMMSLQGENACSKEQHTDLRAAVNTCFPQAPRTNTLLQGSKFGSQRQTKLLELIIQLSPQELLTHFIFFSLKEWYYLSRNLLSPRNIIHQQKYDISKKRIRCLHIYCFLYSILYTNICLISSSLSEKLLLSQTIRAHPSE